MISRKPNTAPKAVIPENKVEALINKGGSTSKLTKSEDETANFTLRIPKKLLNEVDQKVQSDPLKKTRNFWILEAIAEKLKSA